MQSYHRVLNHDFKERNKIQWISFSDRRGGYYGGFRELWKKEMKRGGVFVALSEFAAA